MRRDRLWPENSSNSARWPLAARALEQTFILGSVEASQAIAINEIHYNSPNKTIREEFIELYNPTDAAVDISNWSVRGGIDYFFPANTSIPARGFLIVAEHPATIASRYGIAAFGPWQGGINNDGEEITLRNALNDVVEVVDFQPEFPWPIAADGEGASMQLVNPSLDNDLGSSWRSGIPPTPGATNVVFATNAAPNTSINARRGSTALTSSHKMPPAAPGTKAGCTSIGKARWSTTAWCMTT